MTDEPSLRLLRQVAERQERHLAELGQPGEPAPAFSDLGALPCACARSARCTGCRRPESRRETTSWRSPPTATPILVDELYVNGGENHVPTEPEEQRHFFHALMDAELSAAELMARNSHEHPEMPWDFHVDMARQTWDELRHARVHDVLMRTELDCAWGDYPVGFSYFRSIYALDLLGRLALFNSTSEQGAMWRHSHRRKVLVGWVRRTWPRCSTTCWRTRCRTSTTARAGARHLLGGDERAYRDKVRELRAGLDRTGAPAKG